MLKWYSEIIRGFQGPAGLDRWYAADLTIPPIFGVRVDVNPVRGRPIAPSILHTLGHHLGELLLKMAADTRERTASTLMAITQKTVDVLTLTVTAATGLNWHLSGDATDAETAEVQARITSDGNSVWWQGVGRLLTLEIVLPPRHHPDVFAARALGYHYVAITSEQQSILCEMLCDLLVQILRAQLRRPSDVQAYHDAVLNAAPPAPPAWASTVEA